MTSVIDGIQPAMLWHHFAALCAIPHCSGNEAGAAAYVTSVAKRNLLPSHRDSFGNLLVRKPASPGREGAPSIALQCHLDMVGEKNGDSKHDFSRNPLVLRRAGDFIAASGTTLGADNGIGVATCLALMEERELVHGPLEFLFTVEEETGLTGAQKLSPGFLSSCILINLDSEEDGVICVGCAGGGDTAGEMPLTYEPIPRDWILLECSVAGLRGGHSGLEIHADRGNAIKLLGRTLSSLLRDGSARLCSINGGTKRNAIPREASAVVVLPRTAAAVANKIAGDCERLFRNEHCEEDPKASVTMGPAAGEIRVMTREAQENVLGIIEALPHGVVAMSDRLPGLVETSTNLAAIATREKKIVIETSQRSFVEREKVVLMKSVRRIFEDAGASVTHDNIYPGWEPDASSGILATARETYRRIHGHEPSVEAVHAGLECGIIGQKYPGMDMVSIGPTMKMVHSPEERVEVASVKRYWDFLLAILSAP